MKKDVKSSFLIAVFCLFIIPLLANDAFAAGASCLTVRFSGNECIVTGCDKNVSGELIIPEKIEGKTVSYIADGAFERCKGITEVVIPDTVIGIGNKAFYSCTGLKKIKMTDSVRTLGNSAFSGCYSLEKAELSNELASIGKEVFYLCNSLKTVNIPAKAKALGESSFFDCSSLENVVLPEGLISISSGCFSDCDSLESVFIPESVVNIGRGAFEKCNSLETVYYGGYKTDFNSVVTDYGNDFFLLAEIEYNHDHISTSKITVIKPNCTAKGYSIYDCCCSYSFIGNYVKAKGHNLSVRQTVKSAGCTTTGLLHNKCKDCNYYETVTVPSKGHTAKSDKAVKATCAASGKTEGSHCSVCGKVIKKQSTVPAKGHNYSIKIKDSKHLASKATYKKAAKYYYSCSSCGKIGKDKTFSGEKLTLANVSKLSFTSTNDSITLSWSKVSAANGYAVYQKTNDGKWKQYKTVKKNSIKISGLSNGKAYTYAVRAYVTESGSKVYSSKYVSLKVATKPLCPSKLTATQNNTAITLKWNKSKGVTGYRVYRYDSKNKKWEIICSKTKADTFTIKKLGKGVTYKFSVKAYIDTGKQLVWSESRKSLTTCTKPASPVLKSTAYKTAVKLEWKKVSGADGYIIYISEDPNSGYKKAGSTTKLTYKKEKLKSGKTYYFKVYAYKKLSAGNVNSYASTVKKIKTK